MSANASITNSLQENLITLLCYSDEHGRIVANLANAELFEGELRTFAERGIKYWKEQGEAPKLHTPDLFADILEDQKNRKAVTYRRLLDAMYDLSEAGVNAKYVLHQLHTFTRLQHLKDAVYRAAELLHQPKDTSIDEVEGILSDILRARDINFNSGTDLTNYQSLLDYLDTQFSEFDTGIAEFDKLQIVPARGTMFTIIAPFGKGKTWGLIHLGRRALMHGKKVLHISLEMSEEDVKQRYYQGLFSVTRSTDKVELTTLDRRKGDLVGLNREDIAAEFAFTDKYVEKELETRIVKGGVSMTNVKIKRFPTRGLTINMLRGYLDSLETTENWIPDMLVLDYPKIMKIDLRDFRLGLGQTFEDFRGICVERNIAGVTAHQSTRAGATKAMVRSTDAGEDISVAQTSDIIVTFSQTDIEEKLGLGRLFADKVRNSKGKQGVLVTQSYEMGQFALDSHPLSDRYSDYLKDMASDLGIFIGDTQAEEERDDA